MSLFGLPMHSLSVSSGPVLNFDADGLASGGAFLAGELEKFKEKVLEPLSNTDWARDIKAEYGGGPVDFTSQMFVDFASPGANEYGLINGATTVLPIIQANTSKDVWRVHSFGNLIRVPFLDDARLRRVGRSLETLLEKGLRINWDKLMDQNLYAGLSSVGTYGLLNHPQVYQKLAPLNAGATSRRWFAKTPAEVLKDVNDVLLSAYKNAEYDKTGIPNHILVPPDVYAYLMITPVSAAADKSIMDYLLINNFATKQGLPFGIYPSRWCVGAGEPATTGGPDSDRMVAYVNHEDRIGLDVPLPLQKVFTQASAEHIGWLTPYVGQVGELQIKFYQCIQYLDGI